MTQVAVGTQIWNYQEIGSGKLTPIMILHGWGRSGNEWTAMAKELSESSGRKVYVLDLPGFGGTSLPQVKTITEYSRLIVEFCRYLEIERAVLIGHSLGGRVGIVLSAKYPEMIEKLVLVNSAGVKPKSIKRMSLVTVAKIFAWVPSSLRKKMVSGMMDEDYRNSPKLRGLYRVIVGEDLRKYLPEIKCGVTVVWGENDPILPLSLTKIYHQLIPDSRVRVVWGARHDPHLDKYEQTLSILQEASE